MKVQEIPQARQPGIGSPLITPREYQRECSEAVRVAYQRGVRRQLVASPTGSGKTVMGALLIRRRWQAGPVLVLAHRGELLDQFGRTLACVVPGLRVGTVKAERDEYEGVDVVLASMPTLQYPHRLQRVLDYVGRFATVIYDEAHHSVAPGNFRVLESLECFAADGPLLVGFTATAGERADGVGLDVAFDEITFSRGILWMILQRYLVDVEALTVDTNIDFDQVKTRGGDFTDESLGEQMDEAGAIDAAVQMFVDHARDRRTVAFTPLVRMAEGMAAKLRALGVSAEHVSGETPGEVRRAILGRVATGETQVIANCGVLTEGFDEPALSCALIARPTKSRPLFIQMAGRVLRPHPSKERALIITMAAPPEAGLTTIADLGGDDIDLDVREGESLGEAAVRTEAEAAAFGGRRAGLRLNARQIDLFRQSRLRWLPVHGGFALPVNRGLILLVPDGGDLWRVVEARGGEFTEIATSLDLGFAQGVGEEQARTAGAISLANAGWRGRPPTDGQLGALAKMRLPLQPTRGDASDAICVATATRLMPRLLVGRGAR